jgi:hypothetical protein
MDSVSISVLTPDGRTGYRLVEVQEGDDRTLLMIAVELVGDGYRVEICGTAPYASTYPVATYGSESAVCRAAQRIHGKGQGSLVSAGSATSPTRCGVTVTALAHGGGTAFRYRRVDVQFASGTVWRRWFATEACNSPAGMQIRVVLCDENLSHTSEVGNYDLESFDVDTAVLQAAGELYAEESQIRQDPDACVILGILSDSLPVSVGAWRAPTDSPGTES